MLIIRISLHLASVFIIWYPLLRNIPDMKEKSRLIQSVSLFITALFIWGAAFFPINSLLRANSSTLPSPSLLLIAEFIPVMFAFYIFYRSRHLIGFSVKNVNIRILHLLIPAYLVTLSCLLKIGVYLPPIAPYRWNLHGYPRAAIGTPLIVLLPALMIIILDNIFFYISGKEDSTKSSRILFLLETIFWYGVFLWFLRSLFHPLNPNAVLLLFLLLILILLRLLRIYTTLRNLSGKRRWILSGVHFLFLSLTVSILRITLSIST